jgi:hypothetical protein
MAMVALKPIDDFIGFSCLLFIVHCNTRVHRSFLKTHLCKSAGVLVFEIGMRQQTTTQPIAKRKLEYFQIRSTITCL